MPKLIVFVNGYTLGCEALRAYWTEKGNQFLEAANLYFGDNCDFHFINGEDRWYSSAKKRFHLSKKHISSLEEIIESYSEIYFVTHSMGSATAEGILYHSNSVKVKTKQIIHFSPANAIKIPIQSGDNITRFQLTLERDRTLAKKDFFTLKKNRIIPKINSFLILEMNVNSMHPDVSVKDKREWDFHYDTKTFAYSWDLIRLLYEKNIDEIHKIGQVLRIKI